MKPLFKVSLLAATVMLAVGCGKEEEPAKVAEAPKAVEAAQVVEAEKKVEAPAFANDDEKAAYAIGVTFANYLASSLEQPAEIGITLKQELVLKGIQDVFAEGAQLNEEETKLALESLDKRVADAMKVQAAEKAAATKKAGDEFRAEFEKQEGVIKTESGLLYQVMTPAEGDKPAAEDTVEVHYVGTLVDGTKFDSSYDRNAPAVFPLNRVIPGWTEGVQLMAVGSKFKLVVPPELGYGDQDTQTIPGNSTLVFEVELLSTEKAAVSEEAPVVSDAE